MSLFEVFREKSVEVRSTEKVFPIFRNARSITEILHEINGETILILNHVSFEVADWINRSSASCTVYTTEPNTLEEWDAVKAICENSAVYIVPAIDMNYIHSNETLYILPDRFTNSAAANVVIITAMAKKEIETQIAIDIGQIAKHLQLKQEATAPYSSEDPTTDNAAEPKAFGFTPEGELQMLREEITKRMNEAYSIIKTEMPNASVDRKTIPLTQFYKKNNIAQGRLRGTWELFDPRDLPKIMDTGIAQRALNKVNKQYTVTVENAYKLIKKEKLPEYQRDVGKIETDYCQYLRGQNTTTVGTEKITVKFMPEEAINASIDELTGYLYSIVPPNFDPKRIEYFTGDAKRKTLESIANVESKTVITAFSAEQLKDLGYVSKLWKAICENQGFFKEPLVRLIGRYYEMLSKQPSQLLR